MPKIKQHQPTLRVSIGMLTRQRKKDWQEFKMMAQHHIQCEECKCLHYRVSVTHSIDGAPNRDMELPYISNACYTLLILLNLFMHMDSVLRLYNNPYTRILKCKSFTGKVAIILLNAVYTELLNVWTSLCVCVEDPQNPSRFTEQPLCSRKQFACTTLMVLYKCD